MEDVQGVITTRSGRVNTTLKSISSHTGYACTIRVTSNRAFPGFSMTGRMMYQGRDVHDLLDPTVLAAIKSQIYPSKNIVSFGDSTTEGAGTGVTGQTIAVQLQALYAAVGDMRTVTPFGVSGQKCASINARQGSAPAVVSLPAGSNGIPEIPASGAVNVTTTADPMANINTSGTRWMAGRLAGVSTVLIKDLATGQYSVQRSTAASAVGVDAAVPFLPDTEAYRFCTYLCWIGTNDILSSTPAQILAYIDQHVGHQATQQKRRVIVMPIINCLSAQLSTILTNYAALLTLVKAKYPADECVDTLSLLQRHRNGSSDDMADIAAGLPPRSLLSTDRYHPGVPGYGVIAAEVKRLLDVKGY